MRLARIAMNGRDRLGAVVDDQLALLPEKWHELGELLAAEPGTPEQACAEALADGERVSIDAMRLLAPIPNPPKYLAVGFNTREHVDEVANASTSPQQRALAEREEHLRAAFPNPRYPVLFNKQTTCIAGPFDPVWKPNDADSLDYEGELVVVIGRRVRRTTPTEAAVAIAGYMVGNDVSIREWQLNTSQVWLGKSFDTHGPTGPWVTLSDSVDTARLRIRTWVNDDLRQDGRVADQILSPAELVSSISSVCTLLPGDLVATGTPGGVGALSGRFLVPGDRVRVEIDGLGAIENEVVPEPNIH